MKTHASRVWLPAFAIAYATVHHQGFLLAPLGEVGSSGTRWADWIDLLTPWLVLGPAAGVLLSLRTGRGPWLAYAAGALMYIQGQGIHLAANSIANDQERSGASPSDVAHLWDEVVGHYLWYAGLAIVIAALAWAAAELRPPRGPLAIGLALAFGATYATNALEGGTVVLAMLTAAGFVVWGLRDRSTIRVALVWAFGLTLLMLIGYGAWHGGFPPPSEVGWSLL